MKSFSEITKEELSVKDTKDLCCNTAEITGMILFGGIIEQNEIKFVTENENVYKRYNKLMSCLNIHLCDIATANRFSSVTCDVAKTKELLNKIGVLNSDGVICYGVLPELIDRECCRRAFARGVFMSGGTVIDPAKNYNLEIITPDLKLSDDLSEFLKDEGFEFKTFTRKSKYVIYTKKSDVIEDFLTYMGAFNAQMSLINTKIEKEIRNNFNRSINGENANYDKTVSASVKQVRAIEKIRDTIGLEALAPELCEIAKLRLENKSKSLSELGNLLEPPLGKSGVNHRMTRILKIAEDSEKTKA